VWFMILPRSRLERLSGNKKHSPENLSKSRISGRFMLSDNRLITVTAFQVLYVSCTTSTNHNSRQFIASNIDSDRSQFNISYCNIPIKDVYHELFDDALQRYNAMQTRATAALTIIMKKSERQTGKIIL